MILLITASARGGECAAALQNACGQPVRWASKLSVAASQLRSHEYTAVILDQNLIDPDALLPKHLSRHLGAAVPIYVNLALSNMERVVREVQNGFQRQEMQRAIATQAVLQAFEAKLRNALTGILLSSQSALTVPALPPAAESKIRSVYALAEDLRRELETSGG